MYVSPHLVICWQQDNSSARDESSHFEVARVAAADPLTDLFGRKHNYLRISVAEKCNLRCVYCMPEEGVQLSPSDAMFSTDELVHVIQMFNKLGVNKLRFTGGEVRVVM